MANQKERAFTGIWIPKHIWLNDDLSPIEKLFLAEIESLSNDEKRGCFASNEYFGNFFKISEGRAANIISALRKRGYINQVFFDGKVRGIRLHENVKAGFTTGGARLHENVKAGFTKRGRLVSRKREPYNIVDNIVDNKEENAGASDPLCHPYKKVGEIYPETFALEAEKEKPLHRGPGAVRVSITDPEFPGVTVVHAVGPKTNPTKTGREKQQRNAPNIHPENETVFQHFSDPAKARAAWAEWLQYKYDQHRERYKNAKSELVKLRSLWEETKGDAAQVERNISHSIGNLYRGIFAPKAEKNGTQQPNGLNKATAQHLDLAQYVGQRRIAAMERAMQNGTLASAPEERQF